MMKIAWSLLFLIHLSSVVDSLFCFPGYCYHLGTCTNSPNATCSCTSGFGGRRCQSNGMKAFRQEIYDEGLYNNTKAKQHTEKVMHILQEHLSYNYQLPKTVEYMNDILEQIAVVMRNQTIENKKMKRADFLPLTQDYVDFLTYTVTILNDEGCTVGQTINCTLNETQYSALLSKAEDNLIQITSVMVMTKAEEGQMTKIDVRDIVSFTVLKSKGKDLPFNFNAEYGSITLPYWETFQDTIGKDTIALNILTYKRSPYGFVNNTEAVSSGIIKVIVTDKRGQRIMLDDPDDPVDMTVDMTQVFAATHTWQDMDKLSDGRSMCVAFSNETYSAFVLELQLQSQTTCETRGLYGNTGYPTKTKYDLLVKTKGINKVIKSRPYGLPLNFTNQVLQITIYNKNYASGGYMDPLVITLKCADDVALRKKRQATINVHRFRTQEISLSQFEGTSWEDTNNAKIDKAEGSHIKFKSTFFGTFATNTLFIPPTTIDFEAIFTNFLERLRNTPHVLVTYVILFVLVVILTLFLRRMDNNDHLIWDYLPLADNKKGNSYRYAISVFTAVRSSRILTSMPYFILEGSLESTGDRILFDGQRQNFRNGTCSNFIMTTENDLGKLKRLTIWTDNKGNSPDWMLSKVIIVDISTNENYIFLCGEWVSQRYGKCDAWAVLEPLSKDILVRETIFTEATRKGFFDDHLWFSISKRPNYSRFTRVQRLWTVVALLCLSMVTSAMWFNQEPSAEEQDPETASALRTVELGPFKLSYKQLYVGLMSSVITFLPSILIVAIFKNRKLKQEYVTSSEIENDTKDVQKKDENRRQLPWWTIFFAYALVITCIACGGTFTFFYSLEFGSEKTNDWLLSFVFGTVMGALLLEPVKVLLLAMVVACCLHKSVDNLSDIRNPYKSTTVDKIEVEEADDFEDTKIFYYPCPRTTANTNKNQLRKKRFKLDNELAVYLKSIVLCTLYILLLAMICSHNITTEAYRQNEALSISINNSFKVNTTDDIWTWLNNYYIPIVWAKYFGNGDLRTAYEQRFTYDGYNYRMSLIQLRQVRSYGNCSGPEVVQNVVTKCTNNYDIETESKEHFCPGWTTFNTSCSDENELTDYSFRYQSSTEVKALPYFGVYAYYNGGGYQMQLGPKQSLVTEHVNELQSKTWIDGNTRAIFIDSNTFNANSRLFTHLKVVFEISEYGDITMTTVSKSSNLYPYVYALDYLILCLQIVFTIIIMVKIILFGINVFKLKRKCFVSFGIWVTLAEIVLAIAAIVFFIIRIDKTIKTVDEINNSNGGFVSFEEVEIYDEIYRACIAGVFFIVILRLLEPLAFNYHLFILKKSLTKAKADIFSYIILLSIILVAFASYLYVTVGKHVPEFRSMPTALTTLLQMLLSMISFRVNVDMSSTQSQVFVSLFAFFVSIIGINVFIGILTWNFYYIKIMQSDSEAAEKLVFNQELNDHFWWRVDQLLSRIILPRFRNDGTKNSIYKKVEQKIECVRQKFNDITKEEIEWTFSTTAIMFMCKKQRKINILTCCVTAQNTEIKYRFFDQMTKSTRLVLYLPYVRPGDAPDLGCRQVPISHFLLSGIPIPNKELAKSDVFEFDIKGDLYVLKSGSRITFKGGTFMPEDVVQFSYDNMKTWQTKLLREEESLDVFSCTFRTVPTHYVVLHRQENIKLDLGKLNKFPDLERHRLVKSEQCIRLRSDKRIIISIPPNAVQEMGDAVIMVEKPFAALCPILQIYSTRKISGCINISLPLNYLPTAKNLKGVTTEFWVLIREKNTVWKQVHCLVEVQLDCISLVLGCINMKTPTAICVKEVVIPRGEIQATTQEWKFAQEINQLSRNVVFRRQWRDLAEKCSVTLTSRFEEYQNPHFISVENQKYVFNMDRCVFRRVTRVPFPDQEKCLAILCTWVKGLKSTIGVTSLITLLREYKLPYLPET